MNGRITMKPTIAAIFAVVLVSGAPPAMQTASACRPPEGQALSLLHYGVDLGTAQGAEWDAKRARYGLVAVDTGEVRLITDEPTCRKAASAVALHLGESRKTDRRVWVVGIGPRYMVTDPTVRAGEFQVTMFFDRDWKFLASLAG
jgi:hypothetical protein